MKLQGTFAKTCTLILGIYDTSAAIGEEDGNALEQSQNSGILEQLL